MAPGTRAPADYAGPMTRNAMNDPGGVAHDAELYFLEVAEHLDAVPWVAAPDGTEVYYVGPAYERIWGRSAAELYASPLKWMQAVHADDQARVFDTVSRRRAQEPLTTEYRIIRPDGSLRYVLDRSVPIRDAAGRTIRVAGLCEDITVQKLQMRQAEAAAHAQRDALVREVHHRIKNNLQGVTGLLRNYARNHPDLAPVLSEAIAQVQAVAIIHGLHGQQNGARVGLWDLLERVVVGICQLLQREIVFPERGACKDCEIIIADHEAVPVALVLNELVFNALKHGDPQTVPRISLKLDLANERVRLSIGNQGQLPVADRAAPQGGDGCGLNLVRSLLPRRGAHFELTSGDRDVVASLELAPPVISLRC